MVVGHYIDTYKSRTTILGFTLHAKSLPSNYITIFADYYTWSLWTTLNNATKYHKGNIWLLTIYFPMNFTWVHTVSQLSAHHSGIIIIPVIITHCSPQSIDADLHPASTLYWSINQTKCSISATLGRYRSYRKAPCNSVVHHNTTHYLCRGMLLSLSCKVVLPR